MKSSTPSPLRPSNSSSRSSSSSSSSGSNRLVKVKCSFCGNTFYSSPREAVCRKCNRPANRPMPMGMRVAAFLVPLFGFAYSLWLRPHSPFASQQGIISSLAGTALYVVLYLVRTLL